MLFFNTINDDVTPKTDSDNSKNLKLYIEIEKPGQNPVKVSFPLATVKSFARIGNGISGILGNGSIEGVKLDEILALAESGAVGELMDVVAEDNSHIVISIK
ncbi:MAG: hypothetical protein J6D06_04645 [Clostridia bacterium]|nr:hypothetical protein [Clostridia bacterium]